MLFFLILHPVDSFTTGFSGLLSTFISQMLKRGDGAKKIFSELHLFWPLSLQRQGVCTSFPCCCNYCEMSSLGMRGQKRGTPKCRRIGKGMDGGEDAFAIMA